MPTFPFKYFARTLKKYYMLVTTIILISLLTSNALGSENIKIPISSYTTYLLTDDEIVKLESLAKNNNPSAAFCLYQYYTFSNKNASKAVYYLTIAANNGNISAQHNLSYIYLQQKDYDAAHHWATKAKEGGNKYSGTVLEEIARERIREKR